MHPALNRKVNSNRPGERVDKRLRGLFPQLSGAQVEEALSLGLVQLDGRVPTKGERLGTEQRLDCSQLERHLEGLRQGTPQLQIPLLHEEEGFWVVDKPAGIPSHPLKLADSHTVTAWAFAKDARVSQEFGGVQPTVTPHRLDTGTSGVLLVARTLDAYETWRKRFHEKQVTKVYLAWCWGVPEQAEWTIAAPIGRAKGPRGRWAVEGKEARLAKSTIEVVRRLPDRFLARVECKTGVTHQVRVHLSSCGYPLIGDSLYDLQWAERDFRPEFHQLRAAALRWEESQYGADCASFSN